MSAANEPRAQHSLSLQALQTVLNEISVQDFKTHLNQRVSPLLRLPGEIRNRIYELALDNAIVIVDTPEDMALQPHSFAGLLQSCRQINREATPIFYKLCTFDFAHGLTATVIQRLGRENLRLIRSIQFVTQTSLTWLACEGGRSRTPHMRLWLPALERCYIGCLDGGCSFKFVNKMFADSYTRNAKMLLGVQGVRYLCFAPLASRPWELY